MIDAWAAAVGGPIVENVRQPSASPRDPVVVSWNTHVGAGDITRLVTALQHGEITGAAVDDFVLLLQEAVRRGSDVPARIPDGARTASRIAFKGNPEAPDIRQISQALGLNVVYLPSMRNGTDQEDRGNAILSTLPLEHVEAIELPIAHQRRVAIAATLSGMSTRVATVHFDTALGLGGGGPSTWRRRQARAVIRDLAGDTGALIVGGDFNTWWGRDEPAVRELQRTWPDAIDRVAGST